MRYNNLKLDADRSFKKGRTRERQNQESRKSRTDRNEKIELRNHKKVRPESNIINSMMSISKIETENMKRGKKNNFIKNNLFSQISENFLHRKLQVGADFRTERAPFKVLPKKRHLETYAKIVFSTEFKTELFGLKICFYLLIHSSFILYSNFTYEILYSSGHDNFINSNFTYVMPLF